MAIFKNCLPRRPLHADGWNRDNVATTCTRYYADVMADKQFGWQTSSIFRDLTISTYG